MDERSEVIEAHCAEMIRGCIFENLDGILRAVEIHWMTTLRLKIAIICADNNSEAILCN